MLSLATEVFSQVDVQLVILNEYLDSSHLSSTDAGTTLVIDMAHIIVSILTSNQYSFCDRYHESLDMCCASANDFFRMSELVEKLTQEGKYFYKLSSHEDKPNYLDLAGSVSRLITLYSTSAVYAAQMTSQFVLEPLEYTLASRLFDLEWEENMTQNEVAVSITLTIDDFLGDIEMFLQNPFLSKKAVDALISMTVVFYTKCLLTKAKEIRNVFLKAKEKVQDTAIIKSKTLSKASSHEEQQLILRQRRRSAPFHDPQRAVNRIFGDIRILKEYFKSLTGRMPPLTRTIDTQFAPLISITECLGIASKSSKDDITDFIFVLHKHTLDYHQTKRLARDLWYLIAPKKAPIAFQAVREKRHELIIMTQNDHKRLLSRVDKPVEEQKPPGLDMLDLFVDLYGVTKKYQMELGPCDGACYSKESFFTSAKSCGAQATQHVMSTFSEFRSELRKGRQRAFNAMKITNNITKNTPLVSQNSSRHESSRSIRPSEAELWTMAIKLQRAAGQRHLNVHHDTEQEEIDFVNNKDEIEPLIGKTRFEI